VVDPDRHAFIAELAFELLRMQIENGSAPTRKLRSYAVARVRRRIGRLAGLNEEEIPGPTPNEYAEIVRLRKALRGFLNERTPTRILAGPKIAGCGIVDACSADLLLERESGPFDQWLSNLDRSTLRLLEVKAVERGFRAADFRQLITYAALMSAAGDAPEAVGLVNPRRGTFFECTMDELAKDTAGLGGDELLQQIVFDVSATEISL